MISEIHYRYVAIEGNIGSGKTTLVKNLSERLSCISVLEEFESNPFLELFYENAERYAFQVELYFLADRFKQLKSKVVFPSLFDTPILADYYLDKCFVFARNNLNDLEFKLYSDLFFIMRDKLPRPDLIIYLGSDVDTLKKNISNRGRTFEKNIREDYLLEIDLSYKTHFKETSKDRIIVIENHYQVFENTQYLDSIQNLLTKNFEQGTHYITL